MQTIKVNTYQKMLSGMCEGRKHSIIKITSQKCAACKQISTQLEKRADLEIDVYDVEHLENKAISRMFGVRTLPTVIFFENAIPMARMAGLKEAEEFLQIVDDVVIKGCSVINWDD
jgi:thioredoxin-like negative regulator of GroEL